jgi:isoleucyl-tRNA synthetase
LDYKATVFLPKTDFPMRGDLPKREPEIIASWQKMNLWKQLRETSKGREKFILHDGPPYANGNIHIGHALNKILKDVINRSQQMTGRDAFYIPGWDCHGLPIEWMIEEKYRKAGKNKDEVPIIDFRKECREFAANWINIQREEFRRLGVEGDWDNPYTTMTNAAEAQIAAEIGKFLMNGGLFRGSKPVLWSVVEKTALAEAEVEYKEHTSDTIWVKFPIVKAPVKELEGANVVIWTTTPWTIPGNRAVAYGEDIDYVALEVTGVEDGALVKPGDRLLVAEALKAVFEADAKITGSKPVWSGRGSALKGTVTKHPFAGLDPYYARFQVPAHQGDFVTTDTGTGFVHIAPGHGADDYVLGIANGIEVPQTVDPDGAYFEHGRRQARADALWQEGRCKRRGYREAEGSGRAGRHQHAHSRISAFLALQGAADLPQHAAMVHLHGEERSAEDRAVGDREDPLRAAAGQDPALLHDREPSGLGDLAPTCLGCADCGLRREEDRQGAAGPAGHGPRGLHLS